MARLFEYTWTETERYWGFCDFIFYIPYPCGFKYCEKKINLLFGFKVTVPYPCGIKMCNREASIPYPCWKNRTIEYTGFACRGTGGNVEMLREEIEAMPDEPATSLGQHPDFGDATGDDLYLIYRKGLISRHITKNGRVLAKVALKKVDINRIKEDPMYARFLNPDHVRHAYEKVESCDAEPEAKAWIPLIAPIKRPGLTNEGYYAISQLDDNPFYYSGGLALAVFSLEHIHYRNAVSSMKHARRILLYMLDSEMWEGSGYIVRRSSFFNHMQRNVNGGPVVQAASPEELIGLMLGLMFYIKAEEVNEQPHPLYYEAIRLRDDILKRVSNAILNYEHPFMVSSHDSSYMVKHFTLPLLATTVSPFNILPYQEQELLLEQVFVTMVTASAGETRSVAEVIANVARDIVDPDTITSFGGLVDQERERMKLNFQDYMMYMLSIILIMEGSLPDSKKQWYAKVFMRDFVKDAVTSGPDTDKLEGNLLLSTLTLLLNKYLEDNEERDSEYRSPILQDIWEGHEEVFEKLIKPFSEPGMPVPEGKKWQSNLPFLKFKDPQGINDTEEEKNKLFRYRLYKDHNPCNKIGNWFVWRFQNTFFSRSNSRGRWEENFPGWNRSNFHAGEEEYKANPDEKTYSKGGYIDGELASNPDMEIQIEGAGLGLMLMRMLLTHINPKKYPVPDLRAVLDHSVLPLPGPEALHNQSLYGIFQFSSRRSADCKFEIEGEHRKALRILSLNIPGSNRANEFIVAYQDEYQKLVLRHGFVSDGGDSDIPHGVYINSHSHPWKHFDLVEMTTFVQNDKQYLLIADRAIKKRTLWFNDYWLRLSLWEIPEFQDGQNPAPIFLTQWASNIHTRSSTQDIALNLISPNQCVVSFITKSNRLRTRSFHINTIRQEISSSANIEIAANVIADGQLSMARADDYLFILHKGRRMHTIDVVKIEDNELRNIQSYRPASDASIAILNLTTIKMDNKWFLLAAVTKDGYLGVYSWELRENGQLEFKPPFYTNNAEEYLLGREADFENATIQPVAFDGKPAFVIAGKGVVREVQAKGKKIEGEWAWEGDWNKSARGLKVIYGYLMPDGRPTLEASHFRGSGDEDAMEMLHITDQVNVGNMEGIISIHKTRGDDGFLGTSINEKQYLQLYFWKYRDNFKEFAWET